MSAARRRAPVWLLGLTNALFGMYGGILVIAVPQLLSARHVPEATIAAMTAAAISPGFWTFLVSPVLDVRFSRRWYSLMTALLSAVLLALALTNLENLVLVEILLVAGFFFANLYQSALGGQHHHGRRRTRLERVGDHRQYQRRRRHGDDDR